MKCECLNLSALLKRAGAKNRDGDPLSSPGIRCGYCVDAALEAKNALVRENAALRERIAVLEDAVGCFNSSLGKC